MISKKYKCIFIHIPKTGGSSIESLIWNKYSKTEENLWNGFIDEYHNKYQTGGLQHLKAVQVLNEISPFRFNNYFKFTIVRNPFDKAVSQFEYLKKRKDLRDFIGIKSSSSFKNYLELIQEKNHVQWEPQTNFIYDSKNELMVDFLGRFEDYDNDVNHILDVIGKRRGFFGKPRSIPHLKKSSRRHYSSYYDEESVKLIEQIYGRDLDLLNYQFDYKSSQ